MPVMDGLTEVEEIRSHETALRESDPNFEQMEIIMVTAYDNPKIVAKAVTLGVKHFLTKPISINQVLPILVSIFGEQDSS